MTTVRRSQPWLPSVLFTDFFSQDMLDHVANRRQSSATPALNVIESENGFRVEFAVPGLSKEDFKLDVDKDNNLIVSAEKRSESEEKKEKYLRKEFGYTRFKQVLLLPEDADKEVISASYDKGVLSVEIPKKVKEEAARARSIDVK